MVLVVPLDLHLRLCLVCSLLLMLTGLLGLLGWCGFDLFAFRVCVLDR